MLRKNWDYNINIEGIFDTGINVIAHFSHPIQEKMIHLLEEVFRGKLKLFIPLSTSVGAR